MSKRYPGNLITGNPVALSQTSNNGIWDTKDIYHAVNAGTWQEPDGIYEIAGSTAFSAANATYLYKTFASGGNRRTWTWSAWVKRGSVSTTVQMFASRPTASPYSLIYFASDGTFQMDDNGSCGFVTVGLFRDPTAWYHLVISVDTTREISTQRIRVFVNGVQQICTYTIPSQNAQTQLNTASNHTIGKGGDYTAEIFDGCMSDLNFVDGQSLDPSYFGYFDPITNIWMPKKYAGSFGVTGFYLPLQSTTYAINPNASLGNANIAPTAYYLNFNGSSRLNIAHTSALDLSSGDFTVEFWYLHRDGSSTVELFCKGAGYQIYTTGGSINTALSSTNTTSYFFNGGIGTLNSGDWNHVALSRVGNNYYGSLNGVTTLLVTSASSPNSGTDVATIGAYFNGTYVSSGGISNLRVVKGTGLYTRNYVVPNYNLTAIPGTQLLTGQNATIVDNSPNALSFTNIGPVTVANNSLIGLVGQDKSGTSGAFTTTGFDLNSLIVDSPTNVFTSATDIGGVVAGNYCKLNPLQGAFGNISITQAGTQLNSAGNSGYHNCSGTIAPEGNIGYFEVQCSNSPNGHIGVSSAVPNYLNYAASPTADTIYLGTDGTVYNIYTSVIKSGSITAPSTGDIIMVAFDFTNPASKKLWFGRNGTWGLDASNNTGNPAAGTNATVTSSNLSVNSNYRWYFALNNGAIFLFNFGQRPFSYAPPTGFKSLNTTSLHARGTETVGKAAIQPHTWVDTSIFGQSSTDLNVTNSGFQPDIVWLKSRTNAQNHYLMDSVRGQDSVLRTNGVGAESIYTPLLSFNSNGFTPSLANITTNTYGYAAWQWRQSPTSGLNIISYTGNGTNNRAISHNLGVVPGFIIVKSRSLGYNWDIYHKNLGLSATMIFSSDSPRNYSAFGSSAPSANNFYTQDNFTNTNNATYIAYVWAEVPGFSKISTWTGNGSTDGTFVYTGFRPKLVIAKRYDTSGNNWRILDSTRSKGNTVTNFLFPDIDQAEDAVGYPWDFLSNGFKLRTTNSGDNANNGTYLYIAFAESPFALNNRAR